MREPFSNAFFRCLAIVVLSWFCLPISPATAVDYDIIYVRAPRYGDTTNTSWQEVKIPLKAEPGTDLMLLHPDGTEEVLVAGGNGAVVDPVMSFDGKTVFYSKYPDVRTPARNYQRENAPVGGADIYRMNLETRQEVRLTFQEFTPNSGFARWSADPVHPASPDEVYLGYGIYNLGPCPVPGGRLVFTSSRNGFLPNKSYTFPNLQLYIMDDDGRNVEQIGHFNLGSALHPTVLRDGRIMFSSYEAQGIRDARIWGLWALWPDGQVFEPLMSAFKVSSAFHFQTQLGDTSLAVVEYYNQNNNGFGTLLHFPVVKPAGMAPFGRANPNDPTNPDVRSGIWYFSPGHPAHLQPRYTRYPFSPPGLDALSGFAHGEDGASSYDLTGQFAGKVTQPSAATNNDVLVTWSPGPANDLDRPTPRPYYDGGIYIIPGGRPLDDWHGLVRIKNDPAYNEQQPHAVVPYSRIYGVPQPDLLPWLPNDGTKSALLPAGTPFGLVGTSSFYKRNSKPGFGDSNYDGLDSFNTAYNDQSSNWFYQGADAGKYSNNEIYAVRILSMEPSSHLSYGPGGTPNGRAFYSHATERLRILGEIPLRKGGGDGSSVLDPEGNPDTSFLARVPADTPFTFQTIDRHGVVLNMAQTWHQVRPGEVRTNCGGCHAHSETPLDFAATAASRVDYQVMDLARSAPILTADAGGNPVLRNDSKALDVEYFRDIKPILQRSCVGCHSQNGTASAGLVLDDSTAVSIGDVRVDGTYMRLANDQAAKYGYKPVLPFGQWRQSNVSRYIRAFQSRRSLLMWKIAGRRLDGWSNSDHPTESVPGDITTLPPGADVNEADLDYTGTQMPPPGSGYQPLTEDEKMTFARWIDLGCPVTSQDPASSNLGWFADDLRPTLTVSSPRPGDNTGTLSVLRFGAYDYYSGLDSGSLSVIADFPLDNHAAGEELAPLFTSNGDFVWEYRLQNPINLFAGGTITFRVKDLRGNVTSVARWFSVNTPRTGDPGSVAPPPSKPQPPAVNPNFLLSTPNPYSTKASRVNIVGIARQAKKRAVVEYQTLPAGSKHWNRWSRASTRLQRTGVTTWSFSISMRKKGNYSYRVRSSAVQGLILSGLAARR